MTMSTSTRMDEAHSLVSMNRNYRREEIKDRIRTGKACSNVKSNMDLASVTPEDIDALPWDDEDMTVKRCKWCDEFETTTHKLLKCVACKGFDKAWYCNKECQKKQWKWHKTWCASQATEDGIPKGAIKITPDMFGRGGMFGK